jgi:putative flippase GtrA
MAFPGRPISPDGHLSNMSSVVVQAMRFGAVGLVNTTVGLSAIYAFQFFFNAGPIIANMLGYAIGIVFSFILNRNWTFGKGNSGYQDLPKFLLLAGVCYLFNIAVVFVGSYVFVFSPYLIQLAGVATYTALMFFGCRTFVFSSA